MVHKATTALLLSLALLSRPLAAAAASSEPVIFAAQNIQGVQGDKSLLVLGVFYFFHDGTFDIHDLGERASPSVAAIANGVAGYYAADVIVPAFRASQPAGYAAAVGNTLCAPQTEEPFQQYAREQMLDPIKHRYVSYLARVFPSDDAFVANDNPKAHEVFDENGRFLGPIVIDLTSEDIYDAGTRLNDETDVPLFDILDDVARGVPTDDVIRRHAGFNGSVANPAGAPKRILGGTAQYALGTDCRLHHVDPALGDFSHPGFSKLNRFRLTSRLSSFFSGAWYDPARSGEGFVINVFDAQVPRLSFTWYTYRADGSGQQKWLIGSAPIDRYHAQIDLYETEGGAMGSQQNPQSVSSRRWGTANVGFVACDLGLADIRADDAEQFRGQIAFSRLTLVAAGAQRDCGDFSLTAPSPPPLPPAFGR